MGIREHFHFKDTAKIYILTWQFILLRFALMLVFIGIAVFYFSSILGVVLSQIGVDSIFKVILSVGSISTATYLYYHIYKLFSRYIFYIVKSAHIALITDYIQNGRTPKLNQLFQGFRLMKDRFLSISLLFVVDRVLEAVLKEVHQRIMKFGADLKLPKALTYIISGTIHTATNYVDEAILAYMFTRKNESAWKSAKDGLILYVKNWMWILATAAILSAIVYGTMAFFGVYVYFEGIPFNSAGVILQSIYGVMTVGIVILAYSGIVQPFMEISIIVTYLKEIKGQTPDSKTFQWVKNNSKNFSRLLMPKLPV
ncbi:MAG: hypothetical protein HYW24_00245 [Candidatus Aenigmarchaeota archaeon]|nr:hypothetical protein [Candidatus Aenigmarchaeota archaeon]